MYKNSTKQREYPNITNDSNFSIDCERLFDQAYAKYITFKRLKSNSREKINYDNSNGTNYERNNFVAYIESNPKFQGDNGNVSASKLINYSVALALATDEKLKKGKKNIRLTKDGRSPKEIAHELVIRQAMEINNSKQPQSNNNYKQSQSLNSSIVFPHPMQGKYTQQPVYYNSAELKTDFNNSLTKQSVHISDDETHKKSDSSINPNVKKANNLKKYHKKRTIKGAKKCKNKHFSLKLATVALTLAIAGGAITSNAHQKSLLENTTYENALKNDVPVSSYLSSKGKRALIENSPMFGGTLSRKSDMFSYDNRFDEFLLNQYDISGNLGLYNYLSQYFPEDKKLSTVNMPSYNELKNIAKADSVFSLSVLQEEFLNANKKNKDMIFANIEEKNDSSKKDSEYLIHYYGDAGTPPSYYAKCDKDTSDYIENKNKLNSEIYSAINEVGKKIDDNTNYTNSVEYYKKTLDIYNILGKYFYNTLDLAVRDHKVKYDFSLSDIDTIDHKIVTKGVDFSTPKSASKTATKTTIKTTKTTKATKVTKNTKNTKKIKQSKRSTQDKTAERDD